MSSHYRTFRLEYELYMFLHMHVDGRRITEGKSDSFQLLSAGLSGLGGPVMIALLQNVLRCGLIIPN